MVSLQQIKKLENRVLKAVEMISSLRDENLSLRGRLQGYENKILELEETIEKYKNENKQIESGIIEAIQKLDILEDSYNSRVSHEDKSVKQESNIQNDSQPDNSPDTGISSEQGSAGSADTEINTVNKSGPEEGVEEINGIKTEEELDIF